MNDEDLRARLRAIDPARPGGPLGALSDPTPDQVKERVMSIIDNETAPVQHAGSRQPRWTRTTIALAGAAVVLAVALGAVGLMTATGDDPARRPGASTLSLDVASGDVMSSCVQFDVAFLRDMPVALAGTVTAVDDDAVTLHVDRWYKGGSADQVRIAVPDGQTSAALDGVTFVEGERYLLTATDGTVNGCGFSGPATKELEAAYDEAFPS